MKGKDIKSSFCKFVGRPGDDGLPGVTGLPGLPGENGFPGLNGKLNATFFSDLLHLK